MTTTSTHQTELAVDRDLPLIRITREFDASPGQVFRAHIDPDLVVQWLGPRRYQMRIDHYDCRTGGSYRYLHFDDTDEFAFYGSFHQVRPSELIIQTFTFEGMPDGVALERLIFEDLHDGHTRLATTSLFETFSTRDAMIADGAEGGVREGYERLDEVLSR
jgi:uncharacterized protein YndB with AHSA1/START domain